jgi:type IV pilus assembly protein PilC
LREVCQVLGEGVERGRPLSDLVAGTPQLPASLVPLLRWGEKTGELADALRTANEMLLGRVRTRAMLLRSISPPVVFILVFLVVGFMLVSLFLPLFSLIQGLA